MSRKQKSNRIDFDRLSEQEPVWSAHSIKIKQIHYIHVDAITLRSAHICKYYIQSPQKRFKWNEMKTNQMREIKIRHHRPKCAKRSWRGYRPPNGSTRYQVKQITMLITKVVRLKYLSDSHTISCVRKARVPIEFFLFVEYFIVKQINLSFILREYFMPELKNLEKEFRDFFCFHLECSE